MGERGVNTMISYPVLNNTDWQLVQQLSFDETLITEWNRMYCQPPTQHLLLMLIMDSLWCYLNDKANKKWSKKQRLKSLSQVAVYQLYTD